jgi:hypothetical protein
MGDAKQVFHRKIVTIRRALAVVRRAIAVVAIQRAIAGIANHCAIAFTVVNPPRDSSLEKPSRDFTANLLIIAVHRAIADKRSLYTTISQILINIIIINLVIKLRTGTDKSINLSSFTSDSRCVEPRKMPLPHIDSTFETAHRNQDTAETPLKHQGRSGQ